ncbi:MAG: cytochrome c [Elusimicrobia bacterium]|nr:cytochrome c [Elusimicrobiota bacterium]
MIKGMKTGVAAVLGTGLVFSLSFAAAPSVDAAKKLYDSKCASCHGKDGKGNAAMSKAFKVSPAAQNLVDEETVAKKDEELLKIIGEGKNKMPAYAKQLKAEEQKLVLQYARGLAEKKTENKMEKK